MQLLKRSLYVLNDYKNRLLQMGEEKSSETNRNANLNNKLSLNLNQRELSMNLNLISTNYALVTFHPVTLDLKNTKIQ